MTASLAADALDAAQGRSRPPAPAAILAAGTVVASLLLVAATANPLVGLAPPAAVALVWALPHLPARVLLTAGLATAVFADIGPWRDPAPGVPKWIELLQQLTTLNLNKLTGIAALRFSGLELLLPLLAVVVGVRSLAGRRGDASRRMPMAAPLSLAFAAAWVTVLALELWGIARGGDFQQSLWQLRALFWAPVTAWLFSATMQRPSDMRLYPAVLASVGCVKVIAGAYFYYLVARPLGVQPQYVTSHADSLLWVVTIVVSLASAYHRPSLSSILRAGGIATWLLWGIVLNNRRTAYVSLIVCLVMFFLLLPRSTKRRVLHLGLLASPLLGGYVLGGRYRSTGIFAPAAMVWSVSNQDDGSSKTRDVENYNLITTLKLDPLVGSGWGHEYVEAVKADDISRLFPQYRYIAHNSILWLWSIGGLVGFILLWMPIVVGVFLAARLHHFAITPTDRVVAYAGLAAAVAFVVQSWSDMGTQSWTTQSVTIFALVCCAKLARARGAWPAGATLIGAPVHALSEGA